MNQSELETIVRRLYQASELERLSWRIFEKDGEILPQVGPPGSGVELRMYNLRRDRAYSTVIPLDLPSKQFEPFLKAFLSGVLVDALECSK